MTDEIYDDAVEELEGGVVDTGDLDDYEEPTLPEEDIYKLRVVAAEAKKISWDVKDASGQPTGERVTAPILELGIRIVESKYKNPYGVRHTVFLPDKERMDEQQYNRAQGQVIRLKEALWGLEDAKTRGFDCNTAVGAEFYALVSSKPNKKDPERMDVYIKRFQLD